MASFLTSTIGNGVVYPVVVNGVRLFSFYRYCRPGNSIYMIMITKYGARKIHKLCEKSTSHVKTNAILAAYFSKCLIDVPDYQMIIDQLSLVVAFHYQTRNTGNYSPYTSDALNNKYLCIISPLTYQLFRSLNEKLSNIAFYDKEAIVKDQLILL